MPLVLLTSLIEPIAGGLFRGPIQIEQGIDRLVLVQGPSTLLKVAAYTLPVLVALGVWACVSAFGAGTKTTLKCDRATGACSVSGGTSMKLPDLSELSGADLVMQRAHNEGDAYYINLVKTDGTKLRISPDGAIADDVVARYREVVATIQKFLADKTAASLDVAWTYRASTGTKVRNVAILIGGVVLMLLAILSMSTRTTTLDKGAGKITSASKSPFGSSGSELALDRVASVESDGNTTLLVLADGGRVPLATPKDADAAAEVLRDVRALIAK